MANLTELEKWENTIYQLETTDPVKGGDEGISNLQAKQLANRTAYLKKLILNAIGNDTEFATTITNALAAKVSKADLQNGSYLFAIDTGVANTYICNLNPALTRRGEGQVIKFKVANANTGTSTINDGLGVVPLVSLACSALRGGEMASGGYAWVQWNSNIGTGSYMLLFCTGTAGQAFATSGGISVAASKTASEILQSFYVWYQFQQTTGLTLTLPPLASTKVGTRVVISGGSVGGSLKANGSEIIANSVQTQVNLLAIAIGESVVIECNGTSWFVISSGFGSPSFQSSIGASGEKRIPDASSPSGYWIIKWVSVSISSANANGVAIPVTFPTAFPNGILGAAMAPDITGGSGYSMHITNRTKTGCNVNPFFTAAGGSFGQNTLIAIGY